MSLEARMHFGFSAIQKAASDLGQPDFTVPKPPEMVLNNGTGNNQADELFTDKRTLAASATESLDLAGVLLNAFGVAITFVKIRGIYIKALAANTNDVQVKGAAVNGFIGPFNALADQVNIPPGGAWQIAAPVLGWAVTAGTGDLLDVTNGAGGTSVDYEVEIVGATA